MSFQSLVNSYKDWYFYKTLERSLSDCRDVLDVGCGAHSPLGKIKKTFRSEGVDIFRQSVAESKKERNHDTYKIGDIRHIGQFYRPKSFDAVIAIDVIEHLTKKVAMQLITDMEKIARKKVILLTPNGFYHQDAYDNNPYQVHKSGWSTKELRDLGYRIRGVRGLKYVRGEYASIKYKPWIFWGVVAFVSEPLLSSMPGISYDLFAFKDLRWSAKSNSKVVDKKIKI